MLTEYLLILQKGGILEKEQIENAFIKIIDGGANNEQSAAFLFSLSLNINADYLFYLVKYLRKKSIKVKSPNNAIDVCGTGGDYHGTLNISTAVAFVTAAAGIATAKHGNRAVSSKSGSSDILNELGVEIMMDKKLAERSLFDNNISFLFAPLYHPALKNVAGLRQKLGVRTIFNLVGPLLNPSSVKKQLIGVFSRKLLPIYAEVVRRLNYEKAIIVSSFDGLDEISVCGKTEIYIVENDKVDTKIIAAKDFSIGQHELNDLIGGDSKYNAERMVKLLKGEEKGAYYDSVVLNAAFALSLSKDYSNIEDNILIVKKILSKGSAYKILNNLIS